MPTAFLSPLLSTGAALARDVWRGSGIGLGLGCRIVDPGHHRDDADVAILRVAGRVISGIVGVGALHVQWVAGFTEQR